jgi:transmembrane sensor
MNNNSENINLTPKEFSELNSEGKILKMASGMVPPAGISESVALNSVLNKIEKSAPAKTFQIKRIFQAAAAIVILLISVYSINTYLLNERATTQFAEQKDITLPDGSEVKLNAFSKVVWSRKHFAKRRLIALNGEAYFDVRKGDEFIINTKKGKVEILGTQLNVFSRNDEFRVSCISGKVRVTSNNQQQTILPGEIAELTASGLIKTNKKHIEQTVSWTNGEFYFEDKPLVSIFAELERQFGISIDFEKGEERLITVGFSNKNLIEALDIVCIPMGLNYEVQKNKKVRIYKKQN